MDGIIRFDVFVPSSLDDALQFMAREGAEALPMAGGTDLIVLIRSGIVRPKKVLDLWPLRGELAFIKREDGWIRIGALTTIEEISNSFLVKDPRYVGFLDMCKQFATPYLRTIATVGGNIGAAHPLSDVAILLLTLDCEVKLMSVNGERWVRLEGLFLDKRKLAKDPSELITEVRFREIPQNASTAFLKFDRRWGHAMGYIVVAACAQLEGDIVEEVRIAFDSMGRPFPERAKKTEEFLKGKRLSGDIIRDACSKVLPKEMKRISDYRASAEYRLDLSKVLLKRALLKIKSRVGGG
ncbi:MAG: FAD binding domain-containing protein [Desulfurococcales archaeon]|nr:FAD binding domain-containing protein [Desulfurococcales archaeon]